MKIVVMGQGYVGLPLAMAAAEAGHTVIGFEPDMNRLDRLMLCDSYVEDIPSHILKKHTDAGTYRATAQVDLIDGFDVAIITVPTPLKDRMPDLSYVREATRDIGLGLRHGSLVVLESTTHPGTTRDVVIPHLEEMSGLRAGEYFHVAFSPERIDPGNKGYHFGNTDKIVAGLTGRCRDLAADFYSTITDHVILADTLEEAEFAKVFENTFRHVNIALVNEAGRMAHALGIDIWNALDLAGTKPFGFMKFTPGPGVGGHCLPVDPIYLSHRVQQQTGQPFRFIDLAQDINESQPAYVVRRLQDGLNARGKALSVSRLLALGLTYKPNTADMRESPAVAVVELLRAKGAVVETVDPYSQPDENSYRDIAPDCHHDYNHLAEYDAVVLLTAHDAFDLHEIANQATYVLDTRGVMPRGNNIERL